MQNYDGQEMEIRETKLGKYQVLPIPHTGQDMTRAPIFETREQAEAYIARPMPEWVAAERQRACERAPYIHAYAQALARLDLRERRQHIQELYQYAAGQAKLAGDIQRAAVYGTGQISVLGRDVGAVRQAYADDQAGYADGCWAEWRSATAEYEIAVQTAMRDADIPVGLFRREVSVD